MTLEEAQQLKVGDYVSAVFKVLSERGKIIDIEGDLNLRAVNENGEENGLITFLSPEFVKKAEKPHRKFRKGDIISTEQGVLKYVAEDEDYDGSVCVCDSADSVDSYFTFAAHITLICAMADRADRKEKS